MKLRLTLLALLLATAPAFGQTTRVTLLDPTGTATGTQANPLVIVPQDGVVSVYELNGATAFFLSDVTANTTGLGQGVHRGALLLQVDCVGCGGGTTVAWQGTRNGTDFFPITARQVGGGVSTLTLAQSTTTAGTTFWLMNTLGADSVRVNVSSYSAGTITATGISSTVAGDTVYIANGTAGLPLQVSLANTGANATAVKVDGSAVTQPVSGTVTVGTFPDNEPINIAQMNGVAVTMGNGASGTGVQRVTIADNSTGTLAVTQGTAANLNATVVGTGTLAVQPAGSVAHDATATSVNPNLVGGYSSAAAPTDVTADGEAVRAWHLRNGAQAVQPTFSGTLQTAGNGSAATAARVTLANDSTGQVTLATGSNTIGALTANQSVNVAQINGVTPLMGAGNTGTGSHRVTIATDQAALPGLGIYVEDAAETAGGNLTMAGSVRRDAAATSAGSNNENATLNTDSTGLLWSRTANPCSAQIPTTVAISATADTVLVSATASVKVYICSISLVASAAEIVSIWEGTGSTCGTSSAALVGSTTEANGMSFAANGGIAISAPISGITANVDVCLRLSGSNRVSGYLTYVKQ